jgi:deoxyribose-phosphate aldolase
MKKIDNFSKLFDNTNLKAFATEKDIQDLCLQSIEYNFKTVAINTAQCEFASKILDGTDVGITGVISFPLGQTTISDKVHEVKSCLAQSGVTDIDYVVNISKVKARDKGYLLDEMKSICDVSHENGAIVKVIFENAYLTDDEKKFMCDISNEILIDFVKTSTGFAPTGATLEDVKLMRQWCESDIQVKAAGGIRTLDDVLNYVEVGATRIGASAGAEIVEEYNSKQK